MTRLIILGLAFLFLGSFHEVSAHSGRTNSAGCHTCYTNCASYGLSDGEYHCHNGGSTSSQIQTAPVIQQETTVPQPTVTDTPTPTPEPTATPTTAPTLTPTATPQPKAEVKGESTSNSAPVGAILGTVASAPFVIFLVMFLLTKLKGH